MLDRDEINIALRGHGLAEDQCNRLAENYGGHLGLLIEALASPDNTASATSVERMLLSAGANITPDGAQRLLDLARRPALSLASTPVDLTLSLFVYYPTPGWTSIPRTLAQGRIEILLVGGCEEWPARREDSVRRFLARIFGQPEAVWFDRYFGTGLEQLQTFLDGLSKGIQSKTALKLLGSDAGLQDCDQAVGSRFLARVPDWRTRGLQVSWHAIDRRDFRDLHDRQLVNIGRREGFSMPPCDRVYGIGTGRE